MLVKSIVSTLFFNKLIVKIFFVIFLPGVPILE